MSILWVLFIEKKESTGSTYKYYFCETAQQQKVLCVTVQSYPLIDDNGDVTEERSTKRLLSLMPD